jgi:RNA polymerase sigma-70 factor (ECF subfamily)
VLIDAARAGDAVAFGQLVDRHRRSALRLAYVIVGDDAEDVAQEAFLRAHRGLHAFTPGEPFRPWLLAIVANLARNQLRSVGRRERLALRLAELDAAGEDRQTSPEDVAVVRQRRQVLLDAVIALDERDREIVALRYFLELSEAESAEILGCPVGTIKSRLSRAVGRLRTALEAEVAR